MTAKQAKPAAKKPAAPKKDAPARAENYLDKISSVITQAAQLAADAKDEKLALQLVNLSDRIDARADRYGLKDVKKVEKLSKLEEQLKALMAKIDAAKS